MKQAKRRKLQRAGFKVGSVQEFLGLSDEEMALIDLKIRLMDMLRAARESAGMTQQALAKRLGSSQSRVAKMEAGSSDVSIELLMKGLFALGLSRQAIGRMIAAPKKAA